MAGLPLGSLIVVHPALRSRSLQVCTQNFLEAFVRGASASFGVGLLCRLMPNSSLRVTVGESQCWDPQLSRLFGARLSLFPAVDPPI